MAEARFPGGPVRSLKVFDVGWKVFDVLEVPFLMAEIVIPNERSVRLLSMIQIFFLCALSQTNFEKFDQNSGKILESNE